MRKRIVWYALIAVAALIVVANKSGITGYIADVWIESAKKRMINEDAFGFRYAKIDSLYEKKRYAYFLFVENGLPEKMPCCLAKRIHCWSSAVAWCPNG